VNKKIDKKSQSKITKAKPMPIAKSYGSKKNFSEQAQGHAQEAFQLTDQVKGAGEEQAIHYVLGNIFTHNTIRCMVQEIPINRMVNTATALCFSS
jgi:hypothetical protein